MHVGQTAITFFCTEWRFSACPKEYRSAAVECAPSRQKSDTPLFSAIDDSVSPRLRVYGRTWSLQLTFRDRTAWSFGTNIGCACKQRISMISMVSHACSYLPGVKGHNTRTSSVVNRKSALGLLLQSSGADTNIRSCGLVDVCARLMNENTHSNDGGEVRTNRGEPWCSKGRHGVQATTGAKRESKRMCDPLRRNAVRALLAQIYSCAR